MHLVLVSVVEMGHACFVKSYTQTSKFQIIKFTLKCILIE